MDATASRRLRAVTLTPTERDDLARTITKFGFTCTPAQMAAALCEIFDTTQDAPKPGSALEAIYQRWQETPS